MGTADGDGECQGIWLITMVIMIMQYDANFEHDFHMTHFTKMFQTIQQSTYSFSNNHGSGLHDHFGDKFSSTSTAWNFPNLGVS